MLEVDLANSHTGTLQMLNDTGANRRNFADVLPAPEWARLGKPRGAGFTDPGQFRKLFQGFGI